MTDDRFDDFLRDAARSYNEPPATPRDAIWQRVRAAREQGPTPAGVRPIGSAPSRRRTWVLWVSGIAAALLLGIGIGRITSDAPSSSGTPAATGPTIATQAPDTSAATPATGSPATAQPDSAGTPRGGGGAEPRVADNRPHPKPSQWERNVPLTATGGGTRPESMESGPVPTTAYRVAAVRHLGQAEALLTSFRASRAGGVDSHVSAWADDLLSTTRLLLDSPAGSDPAMRKLLNDLELVLAQIAQLPAQREAREVEMIEQSVEQRNVMMRLRTLVPPGFRPSGT